MNPPRPKGPVDQEVMGERIAAARRGLIPRVNQEEIAEAMGVHPQTVSDWERGLRKPSIQQLAKLCGLLGVGLDYVTGISDETFAGGSGERERLESKRRTASSLSRGDSAMLPAISAVGRESPDIAMVISTLNDQVAGLIEDLKRANERIQKLEKAEAARGARSKRSA